MMIRTRINILIFSICLLALLFSVTGGAVAENNTSTEENVSTVSEVNLSDITVDQMGSNQSLLDFPLNGSENISLTGEDDEVVQQETENPEIYTGIVHPDTDTDITRSTPSGNPLIQKYALGGVSIDINAHLMEGRDSNNISSDLLLHDHTDAQGYIKTLVKDFHYMGGEDPS